MDLKTLIQQGINFHIKGNLADARKIYEAVIDIDPTHADATHLLGVISQQSGDPQSAFTLISRAITLNPNNPSYHSNLGATLRKLGNAVEAISAYQRAIHLKPIYPEALNNLGNAWLDSAQPDEAIHMFRRAIDQKQDYREAWLNLGKTLVQQGRYKEAVAELETASKRIPSEPRIWTLLGIALTKGNNFEAALESHDQALLRAPKSPDAQIARIETLIAAGTLDIAIHQCNLLIESNPTLAVPFNLRGMAYQRSGLHEDAISDFNMAILFDESFASAYRNRALSRIELNLVDLAIEDCRSATEIEPTNSLNYSRYGIALYKSKDIVSALDTFEKALSLNSQNLEAIIHSANALAEADKLDLALARYRQAVSIAPNNSDIYFNKAFALQEAGQLNEALESYRECLRLEPTNKEAHNNIAAVFRTLNKMPECFHHFDLAIQLGHEKARWNKAVALLLFGNFVEGWQLYEARWEAGLGLKHTPFAEPLWLGKEDIKGKTILLHPEQGFGDTIQFSRYATLVADLGAEVILEVPSRLKDLAKTLKGIRHVIASGDERPEFEFQTPLLSLPLAFSTTAASIPAEIPYLEAENHLLDKWLEILRPSSCPRVGVVWRGNPENKNDKFRSMELKHLIENVVSARPNIEFISIQKDPTDEEKLMMANSGIRDTSSQQDSFSDAAALCKLMDLIITVDTAVAHLAGALGSPTWILLSKSSDFRWLVDRNDTPWYPTAQLFRQKTLNNWDDPLKNLLNALNQTFKT